MIQCDPYMKIIISHTIFFALFKIKLQTTNHKLPVINC